MIRYAPKIQYFDIYFDIITRNFISFTFTSACTQYNGLVKVIECRGPNKLSAGKLLDLNVTVIIQ